MRTAEGYWGKPWTPDELAYLRENYTTTPSRDIAEHLGRSYQAVVMRASQLGLKARHRTGVNSLVKDYFKIIDTPMKAYVLGLLMADGFVSRNGQVSLALHEKDRALVESVRDDLAPGARVGSYKTRATPMVRFSISAPGLVQDLASHGVVNAKSLITVWPSGLPTEFVNSFVCGYYDGDGSLGLKPWFRWTVVSGNPDFLQEMQAQVLELTGLGIGGPYQDRRHQHAWSIISTGEPVRALDAWVHKDVPGLARKRLSHALNDYPVS